jgi:hypothetical protein
MADRLHTTTRDLVAELRRVDDAFGQLKPSRNDVIDALLAGDADVLIAEGNRSLRATRVRQGLAALGSACALVATIFVVAPVAVDHRLTPPPAVSGVTASTAAAPTVTATSTAATRAPAATTATTTSTRPMPVVTSTGPQLWQPVSTTLHKSPAVVELSSTSVGLVEQVSPSSPRRVRPRSLDVRVQGLAEAAPDVVTDDDVQAAVLAARSLAARGAPAEAADVLGALLARGPGGRVADVVLSEQASLLAKAGRTAQACGLWSKHRQRFASSDNGAAVAAALTRHQCP